VKILNPRGQQRFYGNLPKNWGVLGEISTTKHSGTVRQMV